MWSELHSQRLYNTTTLDISEPLNEVKQCIVIYTTMEFHIEYHDFETVIYKLAKDILEPFVRTKVAINNSIEDNMPETDYIYSMMSVERLIATLQCQI